MIYGQGVTQQRFDSDPPPAPAFIRGAATCAIYAQLALLTTSYGIIGPLMPFLRHDLGLSYTQGSYHTVALALGVMSIGVVGQALVRRLGRRDSLLAVLVTMATGLMLLCLANHLVFTLTACLLFGGALALSISVAPAVMTEAHAARLGRVMAEANMIAYLGIFLVPGIVSLAASTVGWRFSFIPPVLAYAIYWFAIRHIDFGTPAPRASHGAEAPLPLAYWCFWLFLALGVSAEFCMVVWGASYLESVANLPRAMALWSSMIFPAGMIVGRFAGTLLLTRFSADAIALPTLIVAGLGLVLFVSGGGLMLAVTGLFVTGLGIANLYPVGITLAMQAAAGAVDAASARASLASGSAMLFAPLVIGAVADQAGIGAAFTLLPVLLVMAGGAAFAGTRMMAR